MSKDTTNSAAHLPACSLPHSYKQVKKLGSCSSVPVWVLSMHHYKMKVFKLLYDQKTQDMASGYFENELEWHLMYLNIKDNIEFVINKEIEDNTHKDVSARRGGSDIVRVVEGVLARKIEFCIKTPVNKTQEQIDKLMQANEELVTKVDLLSAQITPKEVIKPKDDIIPTYEELSSKLHHTEDVVQNLTKDIELLKFLMEYTLHHYNVPGNYDEQISYLQAVKTPLGEEPIVMIGDTFEFQEEI